MFFVSGSLKSGFPGTRLEESGYLRQFTAVLLDRPRTFNTNSPSLCSLGSLPLDHLGHNFKSLPILSYTFFIFTWDGGGTNADLPPNEIKLNSWFLKLDLGYPSAGMRRIITALFLANKPYQNLSNFNTSASNPCYIQVSLLTQLVEMQNFWGFQ